MKWIVWGLVGAVVGFGAALLVQRAFETAAESPLATPSAVARTGAASPSPVAGASGGEGGSVVPGLRERRAIASDDARSNVDAVSAPGPGRSREGTLDRAPAERSSTASRTPRQPESRTEQPRRPRTVAVGSAPGPLVTGAGEVGGGEAQPPTFRDSSSQERSEPDTRPIPEDGGPDEPEDSDNDGSTFTRACVEAGFRCLSNTDCCAGLFCEGGIVGYGTPGVCR